MLPVARPMLDPGTAVSLRTLDAAQEHFAATVVDPSISRAQEQPASAGPPFKVARHYTDRVEMEDRGQLSTSNTYQCLV